MFGHDVLRQARRRFSWAFLSLGAAFALGACEGEPTSGTGLAGPFRMTFRLDASFQVPHGGQMIEIALIRAKDSSVVAQAAGTVSATENPSYEFTTSTVMQDGESYKVHYWIDSNFGGGSVGVCDPKAVDHQWSTEFLSVSNHISFTTAHQPSLTEDVCSTFD